jgi:hypothetical protein
MPRQVPLLVGVLVLLVLLVGVLVLLVGMRTRMQQ